MLASAKSTVLESGDVLDLQERDVVHDVVTENFAVCAFAGRDDHDANVVAPSITWLFVSTSPDDVMIMPVPAASPSPLPVLIVV